MLSKEKTLLRLPCHLQKFIEWKRNSSLTLQTTLTVFATHKTACCCSTSIPSKVGRVVKSQPRNPAQQTNPGNYCPCLPPPLASLHQFQVWLWIRARNHTSRFVLLPSESPKIRNTYSRSCDFLGANFQRTTTTTLLGEPSVTNWRLFEL